MAESEWKKNWFCGLLSHYILNCLYVCGLCTTKHIGWPKLCPFIGGTKRSIRPCRKSLVVYNVSTLFPLGPHTKWKIINNLWRGAREGGTPKRKEELQLSGDSVVVSFYDKPLKVATVVDVIYDRHRASSTSCVFLKALAFSCSFP